MGGRNETVNRNGTGSAVELGDPLLAPSPDTGTAKQGRRRYVNDIVAIRLTGHESRRGRPMAERADHIAVAQQKRAHSLTLFVGCYTVTIECGRDCGTE